MLRAALARITGRGGGRGGVGSPVKALMIIPERPTAMILWMKKVRFMKEEKKKGDDYITWFKSLKLVATQAGNDSLKSLCERNPTFRKGFVSFMYSSEGIKYELVKFGKGLNAASVFAVNNV